MRIYKVTSVINDQTFYTDDPKKVITIDGTDFLVVKDDRGRNVMVKKDSVEVRGFVDDTDKHNRR